MWLRLCLESQKAQHLELINCREDPWRWLTHWAWTVDTGDKQTPVKLFPNKIHLFTLTEYWKKYPVLLVPKSRQVSASWLFCGLYLWDSIFHEHRITFVQSKKETDAAALLERMMVIYENLPVWMKKWCPAVHTYCDIRFTKNKSRIMGIPSGADQVRGFQPSGVFVDEAAYVLQVDELLAAVRPAVRGGSRLTLVSSAAPSYFGSLVGDIV